MTVNSLITDLNDAINLGIVSPTDRVVIEDDKGHKSDIQLTINTVEKETTAVISKDLS